MRVKDVFAKNRVVTFKLFVPLMLALLALAGFQSSIAFAAPVPTAQAPASSTTAATQNNQWGSFMYAFSPQGDQGIVVNQDAHSNKQVALTQYVLQHPQYDSVSPNGKNLLFRQQIAGEMQYFTLHASHSGPFYQQLANEDAGNALWTPDNRHVMVLNKAKGVSVVDTQTGYAYQVLRLPYRDDHSYVNRIEKLVFSRDGSLYFVGSGGGECSGVLCRASLADNSQLTRLTDPRFVSSAYVMSPDGQTIYYRNQAQSWWVTPGIYAVNIDGTHTRLVRSSWNYWGYGSIPVGFGAHNALIIARSVGTQFQVVQLGATPWQDTVLAANAAPGAYSLCNRPTYGICAENIALAPSGHAIVVQGTLSNGRSQLWVTDLHSGKQQVIAQPGNASGAPVQLLGWDVIPV